MSATNWVKPHKSDATVRLTNNTLALVGVFTVTTLLPTPSLWTGALNVLLRRTVSDFAWIFSLIETVILGVLLTNIIQASLSLRYPPKIAPAVRTAKSGQDLRPSPAPSPASRRLVSPDSLTATPAAQKSFSASTSSGPGHYAASPLSTPSRTLNYTLSPQAPFDTSISSVADRSLSFSVPPSPSPSTSASNNLSMSAFRSMRPPSAGRPLDGSFFRRLEQDTPLFAQADE